MKVRLPYLSLYPFFFIARVFPLTSEGWVMAGIVTRERFPLLLRREIESSHFPQRVPSHGRVKARLGGANLLSLPLSPCVVDKGPLPLFPGVNSLSRGTKASKSWSIFPSPPLPTPSKIKQIDLFLLFFFLRLCHDERGRVPPLFPIGTDDEISFSSKAFASCRGKFSSRRSPSHIKG